jgi:methylenetetrahydrofolate dehydrogenase (NADP+)/methenyltetrahydrofolate cyclohydrolase
MKIDGKYIAGEILVATHERLASLSHAPRLVAITADSSAATESYLKIKKSQAERAGIHMEIVPCMEAPTTESLVRAVRDAAASADAIIVQLPLPASVDTKTVLDAIPPSLDADVLSHVARAQFSAGSDTALLPPVVAAVREILARNSVVIKGKHAVVIGKGWLVGEPCAEWLTRQGALVTVLTRESGDLSVALHKADIIVSGAGSPGIIQPQMLKQGVALIDAGTSESGGAVVGDADPLCVDIAEVFTPVPGGVGPIAVACLFQNVGELVIKR